MKNIDNDDNYFKMKELGDGQVAGENENEDDLWPYPSWCCYCCRLLKSDDKEEEEPPKDGCFYDKEGNFKWKCCKTKRQSQIKDVFKYLLDADDKDLLESLGDKDITHEEHEHTDASGDLVGFLMTILGKRTKEDMIPGYHCESQGSTKTLPNYSQRVANAISQSNLLKVLGG